MLSNFHTHTTFCDGNNTAEEIVTFAINRGFVSLGFSGHAYTPFDLRYCMKDTEGYRTEVLRLKEKYKNDIQIYLGTEEDAFSPVPREKYDYIISSSHYIYKNGRYFPIDSSPEYFKKCLEAFGYDRIAMAREYYAVFCDFIKKRKPDIVGHFDILTKYDEIGVSELLSNSEYKKIAREAISDILSTDAVIEVNTGAISRNYRSTPYPSEDLLYFLSKSNARLMLSSDSHDVKTLDFGFHDAKMHLYDIGFRKLYAFYNGALTSYEIK